MVGMDRRGALLVFGSAAVWSFGGAIARYLSVTDSWTAIFWRSLCAALFLLGFMLWRDGAAGTRQLFRAMGWAGVGVGLCFATASTCLGVGTLSPVSADSSISRVAAVRIRASAGTRSPARGG